MADCLPSDPCWTADATDPSPSETVTVTASPEPSPPPSVAPGANTGVYLDTSTGAVRMTQAAGVALGVAVWLISVVLGLFTAWLVLP